MKKRSFSGTIDRFEGDYAVFTDADGSRLDIPSGMLPEDCCEGDILDIRFIVKPDRTKEAKDKVKGMIDELAKRKIK